MAAHRYWRLTGFCVQGGGSLELSEARLYARGVPVDASATLACTFTPSSGALSDLKDDLASNVVSWPFAAHSSSGFVLRWDLTGAGADVDAVRFGSGTAANTFPQDVTAQYSDDAETWTTAQNVVGAKYPGPLTLSPEPIPGDSNYGSAVLLLHMDGSDDSTLFADSSPIPKTVTTLGNAKISTSHAKFGGASGLFDGSGDGLTLDGSAGFAFGTGDFTIDMFIRPAALVDFYALIDFRPVGVNGAYINFALGATILGLYVNSTVVWSANHGLAANTWAHVSLCRASGTTRVFVNGSQVGPSYADSTNYLVGASRPSIGINGANSDADNYAGYLDEVRVYKGVALHVANFTPPSAPFPGAPEFAPLDRPLAPRIRRGAIVPLCMAGSALPSGAASGHLKPIPFFDLYNGGWGVVAGTVKQKSTPVNTPLRRRVVLIDEQSRVAIRETWSDAVTGNYEFRGVKLGVPYTVLSYDHTHGYRATVADNLLAEVMA